MVDKGKLPPLALIAGPTASGKSALALALAERTGGVIVNADSAQLYHDLDLVSARPCAADLARAEHQLYGVRDGAEPCSAAEWAGLAKAEIERAHQQGRLPILVGGTGLYLRTLIDGIAPVPPIDPAIRAEVRAATVADNALALAALDPAMAARLRPNDATRVARALEVVRSTGRSLNDWQADRRGGIGESVELRPLILLPPRDWLYARCEARFAAMLDGGAVDEVAALLARKLDLDLPVMRAIGVAEIAAMLRREASQAETLAAGAQATRRYAKRQYTWFANQPPTEWPRLTEALGDKTLTALHHLSPSPIEGEGPMANRVQMLFDSDIDRVPLDGKRVAILGYGNQGRAQALNLKDSGVDLVVGLREGSSSAAHTGTDGVATSNLADAVAGADLVMFLAPDEVLASLYRAVEPHLRRGAAIGFSHGLAIRFGLIRPRLDLDVIMVAPKGPGTALRSLYLAGQGMVALWAVARDASGGARALTLAYGRAIGCGRAGLIASTFAEECDADLFNEAAVVWGAVPAILEAGFETLVEGGIAPEVAFLECVGELKLLAELVEARGLAGMREAISNTAELGAVLGGRRIVDAAVRERMRAILDEIRSGQFAAQLADEEADGYPLLRAARARARASAVEQARARLTR